MNNEQFKLLGYQRISGVIKCETGLRVGGGSETIEIGGLDNPVIKHPFSKEPYIPGSSLKGKMRSLLELKYGYVDSQEFRLDEEGKRNKNTEYGEVHKYKGRICKETCQKTCPITRIFGASGGIEEMPPFGPGRLIVHDAKLTRLDGGRFGDELDLTKTEIKWENVIDRIKGTTRQGGLRQMERVPAGAEFSFEMDYRIFNVVHDGKGDNGEVDKKLFDYVLQGLKLIEMDTLGGSGSRGYGKVEFGSEIETEKEGKKVKKFEPGKVKVTHLDGTERIIELNKIPVEEILL